MSEDNALEAILRRITAACRLKPEETAKASRAIRYYTGEAGCELTWGDSPSVRDRQIEQAAVAAITAHYNLNARNARVPFDTARLTAARMRHSATPATKHAIGRRRPAGERPVGGGKKRH